MTVKTEYNGLAFHYQILNIITMFFQLYFLDNRGEYIPFCFLVSQWSWVAVGLTPEVHKIKQHPEKGAGKKDSLRSAVADRVMGERGTQRWSDRRTSEIG